MDLPLFLRGLIIGFSIAAPVGPIGVLCIRRTLANGFVAGIASGLGAASADAIYGCVAAFGLTAISNLLIEQQTWFRLIGGVFLVCLGIRTFLSHPAQQAETAGNSGVVNGYATTFILTLTNPMTILSFAAIFAGLGLASESRTYGLAVLLVAGVFLGSAAWWLLLSTATSLFRARFSQQALQWVNRLSGVIIAAFGLLALSSLLG